MNLPTTQKRNFVISGPLTAAVVTCCLIFLQGSFRLNKQNQSEIVAAEYDRPTGERHQTRSVVIARHGMVATSQPLAAQAGLDVLRAGGNAIDAAIATNAVLGVVEPMSCGIGGDLFAIYWDAKTEKLYGLNASGRSPYTLTSEVFREKKLDEIPFDGPLSWSVPGCVNGWSQLLERFGTMNFNDILHAAIDHAEYGFPVSEVIAAGWAASAASLRKWPDSADTYLIDGRAPHVGEIFRNPRLAKSYRAIAQDGCNAFYQGPIADQIVDFSHHNGGYLSRRDFKEHVSEWVEPVTTNYRGYDIWELPPNGQGIAALQMLNVLEGYDLADYGRHSAKYLHLLLEAKKLAFADRAKFYADPDFHPLPLQELISKEYAVQQRQRIDSKHALVDVPAGKPIREHRDTVYLCVVDENRNCCSMIQSIYYGFGSQVVPGNVGFALQNRGSSFALDENHLNRLEPHKRPFHTIIPAMATRDGKPWVVFGVMGGDMQPQGHVQVLINMIDFGMNVQAAGDAARIRHAGSATPTGRRMQSDGGLVFAESGIPVSTIRQLTEYGHHMVKGSGGFGGYQAIQIDWKNNVLHGATESRKDGTAVGY